MLNQITACTLSELSYWLNWRVPSHFHWSIGYSYVLYWHFQLLPAICGCILSVWPSMSLAAYIMCPRRFIFLFLTCHIIRRKLWMQRLLVITFFVVFLPLECILLAFQWFETVAIIEASDGAAAAVAELWTGVTRLSEVHGKCRGSIPAVCHWQHCSTGHRHSAEDSTGNCCVLVLMNEFLLSDMLFVLDLCSMHQHWIISR